VDTKAVVVVRSIALRPYRITMSAMPTSMYILYVRYKKINKIQKKYLAQTKHKFKDLL